MITAPAILVFVVEDEEVIQHILEDALSDGGFTVKNASSAEEALAILDQEGHDFKALITDVNLPGQLTGWDVAKRAREINDLIPVIYMTGASAHDWGSKGVPNSLLLTKPFAVAQVVTAVAQMTTEAAAVAARLSQPHAS